jgi:hypothetical protein
MNGVQGAILTFSDIGPAWSTSSVVIVNKYASPTPNVLANAVMAAALAQPCVEG